MSLLPPGCRKPIRFDRPRAPPPPPRPPAPGSPSASARESCGLDVEGVGFVEMPLTIPPVWRRPRVQLANHQHRHQRVKRARLIAGLELPFQLQRADVGLGRIFSFLSSRTARHRRRRSSIGETGRAGLSIARFHLPTGSRSVPRPPASATRNGRRNRDHFRIHPRISGTPCRPANKSLKARSEFSLFPLPSPLTREALVSAPAESRTHTRPVGVTT